MKEDIHYIGALLSQLLMEHYDLKEINLVTLLTFRLWPEYLKHFGEWLLHIIIVVNCCYTVAQCFSKSSSVLFVTIIND